jgi:hypothetical protein
MSTWTKEQLVRLTELAAEGLSSRQIAVVINRQFGTSYTRNAVIGIRSRRGVPSIRKHGWGDVSAERRIVQARKGRPTGRGLPPTFPKIFRRTGRVAMDLAWTVSGLPGDGVKDLSSEPTSATNCTLLELRAHHCRWPIGDLYCGAVTEKVYCPYHHRRAHRDQNHIRSAS